jgi:chlorite dismutase
MPEQTPITLNHFAMVRFTDAYWSLEASHRAEIRHQWLTALGSAAEALHIYQLYGLEPTHDLLLWTARQATDPGAADQFFPRWAAALAPHRRFIALREALWGFTQPSQYTRTRSTQEMDPFAAERMPYLIAYPFVKTCDWYALDQETRQRLMGGHIRTGKQYPDIRQLLLYSYGLQDHEFVVVYETEDLTRFLNLVRDLRGTEARRFTERDWPLHAARRVNDLEELDQWL